MVGPFIFVDEFGPARLPAGQGMDVRPHPHINLATVTYLFDGAIEHRDSIGSHAGDRAGRDQPDDRRAAASSIPSARRQALRADGPSLYGMQTWLALPDGQEEIDPAFDHVAGRRPAAGRGRRRLGARADGDACGARPRRRRAIRRPSMPTSSSTAGSSDPDRRRGRRARGDAGRRRGRARRPARSSRSRSTCSRPATRRGCRARAARG